MIKKSLIAIRAMYSYLFSVDIKGEDSWTSNAKLKKKK